MKTYSRQQEVIHGLIHGLGVLLGISGLPILIGIATAHHNLPGIIGSGIYGFCFLLLFSSSTIYHLAQESSIKKMFKIFDHVSIFFLIAGTYTPFLLVYMNNGFGISLLSILWGLTVVGALLKIWFTGKFDTISTIIYILMGWILLAGGRKFFNYLPPTVSLLIGIGSVLYSAGVFFYVRDKFFYSHAVWHVFVLSAALCHYVAVLLIM